MELKTYFAQDAAGNIIPSAIVNVFLQGTTTLATGLTRADGTPLENPLAADGAGRIQFRAPDGYYDVQVSADPGIIQTLTIQCVDYSEAKSSAEQAQNALNSITGINTNFEQNSREQWRRSLAEAGLTLVSGSFEEGATVNSKADVVWYIAVGQCYSWDGSFPKSVPVGSTPASTGGVVLGAWVSVGDAILRSQITNPSGATLYPELQMARWRDEGDIRGWGAVGDGVTDDTAAICAALDAINGDYMSTVEYGKNRGKLFIPKGTYKTSVANMTGFHAYYAKFIVRCNIECLGNFPGADFVILHAKSLDINGLACKNTLIQGGQFHNITNVDCTQDFTLKGGIESTPTGLQPWRGGSYWNNFTRIRAGTTSGGGKIIIDISTGSCNQNVYTQCVGPVVIQGQHTWVPEGNDTEGNANTFVGLDCSGTDGYVLDNVSVPAQHNLVMGLYGEVNGNGKIRGPWTIMGYRCQYGNMVGTMSHMAHAIGSDPTAGMQGGDFFSISSANLCPSGDWSTIDARGKPVDFNPNSGSDWVVTAESAEPSGTGRGVGYDGSSDRYFEINLTPNNTGFVRASLYVKGDISDIYIHSATLGSFYGAAVKYFDMGNEWRLYKVSAPVGKNEAIQLVVVGQSFRIGGVFASAYHGTTMPTFCGWDKCKGKATTAPTYAAPPVGFIYYRSSAVNPPSDKTYAWIHNGGGVYARIDVAV